AGAVRPREPVAGRRRHPACAHRSAFLGGKLSTRDARWTRAKVPRRMPSFRVENVFDCSQSTFWEKVFFDPEYNRRLFYDELHFAEWRELEQKDEGERVKRRVKAVPPTEDLPGPLRA